MLMKENKNFLDLQVKKINKRLYHFFEILFYLIALYT